MCSDCTLDNIDCCSEKVVCFVNTSPNSWSFSTDPAFRVYSFSNHLSQRPNKCFLSLKRVKIFYHVVAWQCPGPACDLALCSIFPRQLLALSLRQEPLSQRNCPLGPGTTEDTREVRQPGSGARGWAGVTRAAPSEQVLGGGNHVR